MHTNSRGKQLFEHPNHYPIVIGEDTAGRNSRNGFRRHRTGKEDIENLVQLARGCEAAPAEFLPVFAALSRDAIGVFDKLSTVHADCHGASSKPSSACIKVIRDLLLESVNRRLQSIYHTHFRAQPPKVGATHEEKLASLKATRNDVLSLLNSYDWQWLADWLELSRIGESAEMCLRRLANFAFPIKRVNFRFTYHCNIACRHCYNGSGPHLKAKRIPLETMLAIVTEMPDAGIGHLNLTGGEPFLYPEDVTALIAAGRAAGLDGISIYTNGFWASTDEHANRVLSTLAQAGFMRCSDDHIKVSAGVYHQEFIAFDRILTLARNYYARFHQRLRVDFELPPQPGDLAGDIRNRIDAAGLTNEVKLHFRCVAPLGRGKDIGGIATQAINTPCNAIDQIVFDPDGSVRPCCGLNNENEGIVIGRAGQHRLKNLVKSMQNDPVLQFLAREPLSNIFDHLAKTKRDDGYSGQCHLCQDALGDLRNKDPLQAALFGQQNFYPFWFTLSRERKDVEFLPHEPSEEMD